MMFTVQPRFCLFVLIVLTQLCNPLLGLVRGKNGLSLVVHPASNIIRNGTLLQMNCTIINHQTNLSHLSSDNLTWFHNGTALTSSIHVVDSETLQLSIMNASWGNSGQYRCTVRDSNDISEVNASVTIGDTPSAPQIMKWENQEFYLKLYWKASTYDGGLPLRYSLQCLQKDNCSFIAVGSLSESADGMFSQAYSITFYRWWKLWIEAENDVGSSTSYPINIKLSYNFETMRACPPVIKSVRNQTRAIVIQLGSEGPECSKVIQPHIYNISYREARNSHLESKLIGPTSQRTLRLEPLKLFTQYYVYISVQLEGYMGEVSLPSSVVGPLIASTKEEAPSEGPTGLQCSSVVWPKNRCRMNVTIKWKPPPYSQRNGIIRQYRVMDNNQSLIINSTSSIMQVVLSSQDAHEQRNYYIQACTVGDACSSFTSCTVYPVPDTKTKRKTHAIFVIVGVLLVVLTAIIFAICLWYKYPYSRKSSSRYSRMPPLPEMIGGLEPQQSDFTDSSSTSSFEPYYSCISFNS